MPPRSVSPSHLEGKSANALAQARHRQKKKAHIQNLEEEVSKLKEDNEELKEEIERLKAQHRSSSSTSSAGSSKGDELAELRRYVAQLESALPESHASRRPPSSTHYPIHDARRSSGTSSSDDGSDASPSTSNSTSSSSRDRHKDSSGSGRPKKRAAAPDWGEGVTKGKGKGKGKERARSSQSEEGGGDEVGGGGGNKFDAIRSAWPSADPKVLLALEKSASKSKSKDRGKGKEAARKGSGDGKPAAWTSDWWEGVRSNSTSGPSATTIPNPSTSRPDPLPNNPYPSAAPPQGYPISHPLYNRPDVEVIKLPNRNPPSSRVWTIPFPPPALASSRSPQPQPTYDSVSSWGGPGGFLPSEGRDEARADRERAREEWGRGLVAAASVTGDVLRDDQGGPLDGMQVESDGLLPAALTVPVPHASTFGPSPTSMFASNPNYSSFDSFHLHRRNRPQTQAQTTPANYQPPIFHFKTISSPSSITNSSSNFNALFPPKNIASTLSNLPPLDTSSPTALGHLPTFTLPGMRGSMPSTPSSSFRGSPSSMSGVGVGG